jgi:DNA-binding response OmpR family regulator
VKKRILLVEDDSSISLGLRMNLEREGYEVDLAEDGEAGLARARDGGYDLVLLDLMLPKLNGYELLDALRKAGNTTHVLLLSARSAEMDKVMGLDLGADDYIPKPFSVAELLARVRAALRRGGSAQRGQEAHWRMGAVEVDPARRHVHKSGSEIELTAKEFEVLQLLKEARGRVLSRQAIFDHVWSGSRHGSLRTIDNFILQLRGKLEDDPAEPRYLLTVRGVGYRLDLAGNG